MHLYTRLRSSTLTLILLVAVIVLAPALQNCLGRNRGEDVSTSVQRPLPLARRYGAPMKNAVGQSPGLSVSSAVSTDRKLGSADTIAIRQATFSADFQTSHSPRTLMEQPTNALLTKPTVNQEFISSQISKTWERYLSYSIPNPTASRSRRVLVHPGLVPIFGMNGKGSGPKGELVQWASLIAAIARLGHNLTVAITPAEYGVALASFKPDCIFTDYAGIRGYLPGGSSKTPGFDFPRYYAVNRCRYYVLDIYGTSAEFNAMTPTKKTGFFNGLQLPSLKQYLSWIPDTIPDPENSFLGFAQVIDRNVQRNASKLKAAAPKSALVWGKERSYWTAPGVMAYLERFTNKGYTLHATMGNGGIPKGLAVHDHGSMSPEDFIKLLASAELFIGLGDPIIGPSPIEALAYGCVYFNPKFVPPKDLAKYGKPSHHEYTSQVPLLEAIGEPHVYTVAMTDLPAVDAAIDRVHGNGDVRKAMVHEVSAFAPEAFIARVDALIGSTFC